MNEWATGSFELTIGKPRQMLKRLKSNGGIFWNETTRINKREEPKSLWKTRGLGANRIRLPLKSWKVTTAWHSSNDTPTGFPPPFRWILPIYLQISINGPCSIQFRSRINFHSTLMFIFDHLFDVRVALHHKVPFVSRLIF